MAELPNTFRKVDFMATFAGYLASDAYQESGWDVMYDKARPEVRKEYKEDVVARCFLNHHDFIKSLEEAKHGVREVARRFRHVFNNYERSLVQEHLERAGFDLACLERYDSGLDAIPSALRIFERASVVMLALKVLEDAFEGTFVSSMGEDYFRNNLYPDPVFVDPTKEQTDIGEPDWYSDESQQDK